MTDDIEVLSSLEAVGRRPAMYIGELGPVTHVCLVVEVACLAAEQLIRGAATSASAIVADDGITVIAHTIRSHKTGGDTTIVCTGAYIQKGINAVDNRSLMATCIATTPAIAKYAECVLVRAPAAGEATTLGSLLLASDGL